MIKFSELKKILKDHRLRVTDCRMDILAFFIKSEKALSLKQLEKKFQSYDRVTLYRTLNSFTANELLHKIPDDSGTVTYGLRRVNQDPNTSSHDHIHFKCNECGTIECIDKSLPKIEIPGYLIKDANLIVNGTCKSCIDA